MADVYIFDTNSFVESYKKYYAFDIAPGFWRQFEPMFKSDECILMDVVYNEIAKNKDALYSWMNDQKKAITKRNAYISQYSQVMNHVQTCGYYNQKGLNTWADFDHADPWIVAAGMALNGIIVTFETPEGNKLGNGSKMGKVKVADVAKHFDVRYQNLYDYMRDKKILL